MVLSSMPTASADENPSEEAVIRLIEAAEPVDAPPIVPIEHEVTDGVAVVESVGTASTVSVPTSPDEAVVVDPDAAHGPNAGGVDPIGIGLPEGVEVDDGVVTDSGAVVYEGDKVDVAVQAVEDGSVRISTVIADAGSPHEFTYELSLPASATLKLLDDGSIAIMADGSWLGGVAAPWATDAVGRPVETRYVVDGQSFTQVVEAGSGAVYPIVADPWPGISLVSSTKWEYNSTYKGYTLKVYPTWWGRYGVWPTAAVATYWMIRSAFWSEVKAKTWGTREENTSMRDQLYCHIDFVRLKEPNRTSWNLDTWRPVVSYATMIKTLCNPN